MKQEIDTLKKESKTRDIDSCLLKRPRRLRKNPAIRALVEETKLTRDDFIYPIFVKEDSEMNEPSEVIEAMPGISRHGVDSLLREVEEVAGLGIKAIALFPVIGSCKKSLLAKEAYNPHGLCQRVVKEIKSRFPQILVVTDVALDPYTTHGHDGIIQDGKVLNDETVSVLAKMALEQAYAGADFVAPSDMMDGRVGIIRRTLDEHDFQDVGIISYTAKYASSFYAPFREALGSLGSSEEKKLFVGDASDLKIPKDKKTYQMNPANSREALRELELDIEEGADIVMVKPAGFYLDVISKFKEHSSVPVAAYQVSGEYSMLMNAIQHGLLDKEQAIYESLIAIKRAGADIILSYFAKYAARNLI